jgi:hypothetical protein
MTLYLPDFMPDLKYWVINNPVLAPLHGGRVYFRAPQKTDYPFIRLYRVGGTANNPQIPVMTVRISFEIRGGSTTPGKGAQTYDATRNLSANMESELWAFEPGRLVPIGTTPPGMTYCLGIQVLSNIDLPDAPTGDPRFILDAHFYMRMAGDADP